jgi:ribonucleoside-diphosphate reductase beta chain
VTTTWSAERLEAIEGATLAGIGAVDIDDVLEYVHKDLRGLPSYMSLYDRYLRQRWNVNELDFTQDRIDWTERMTPEERDSFLAIASGFHHGERQVEVELPTFMLGASEEEKIYITSQIEDEARHTVFFDRFYREVVGLEGSTIMEVLDNSYQWVSEVFVGPFGLLAYLADAVRNNPEDRHLRARYATTYFLWIEGVLALSVMKITLGYCRKRGFLPAYYAGFTATARDEARHVQFGMKFLQSEVRRDPELLADVFETLRTILFISSTNSRLVIYEPLGWSEERVLELLVTQLTRKLNDVGIDLPADLQQMVQEIQPVAAGG